MRLPLLYEPGFKITSLFKEAYRMKKLTKVSIILAFLMSTPFIAIAGSHQDHGDHAHDKATESGNHGKNEPAGQGISHEHDGMTADGTMIIVGSMVSKGVKGMAHLKDVSATMDDLGMKTTHHFMIAFMDEKTGELIESGRVALKITNPDAKVGEPIQLTGMDGHFGADVNFDMPGEYHFRLGTELVDGIKRKYHFHHVIE